MIVNDILTAKGSDVVSIEPTAEIAAAADLLAKRRIGSVLILGPGGRIAGILSERDIVRALADHGPAALQLPVGQAMTRDVITCGRDDTIASLMEHMTKGKFRHLPVMDGNALVGIVSIGDVVKQRLGEIERESEALREYIQTA